MGHLRIAILLAVLTGCSSCSATQNAPPSGPDPVAGLSEADQAAATVEVIACDQVGSGVIVSERHVLTAFHVVQGCGIFVIKLADGTLRIARLEVAHSADLARLIVLDDKLPNYRLRTASSSMGQPVCLTAASPKRVRECGIVKILKRDRNESGDVRITAKVVKGNSGAPAFDEAGRLVGVVVQCDLHPESTEEKPKCAERGGGYTSVDSVRWLVEATDLR